MAGRAFVAALTLALLAVSSAAEEHVVTLTAKNFDEEVKKHDFVVVEFYAPWCGHCKSLAPEYEKAAKALKEEGVPIVLAKVDADNSANKPLASKYGVQGFPTLKIFRGGDLESAGEYKGPREAEGIVSFLKKQAGPASEELKSGAEIKAALEAESVLVVGVFTDPSSPEFETFKKVADALRSDYVFKHTADASLLPVEHPKIDASATVRVLTTFDEGYADTTEFEVAALKEFISSSSVPVVVEFSQDPKDRPFLSRVFELKTKKLMLFYSYNESNADEFKAAVTEVAKTKPEGISFVKGEASQNEHALKYFGIEMSDIPTVVIHDPETNSKYYRTGIKPATVKEFVENFLAGKEEKKLKSEAVPKKKDDGGVVVVVGKTFEELVANSNKNVLIEFYAPWCGHCKKLDPIYKQVAAHFKDDPTVVIAKLDYTANDLSSEKFKVEGFPTLYFKTASGDILKYEGDRSKKDLIKYVKENKEDLDEGTAAEEAELAEAAAEADAEAAEAAKDEL